jgi:hypothetical protein
MSLFSQTDLPPKTDPMQAKNHFFANGSFCADFGPSGRVIRRRVRSVSAVTAGVCSRLHALNMHGKVTQRDVSHLDRKSGGSGESGLLECDIAPKGCFDGETLAVIDMVPDKRLKLAVHHLANFARNAEVRAAIQFRGPIIRVEKGDSEAGHWVQRRLAAAGRTGGDFDRTF